MTQPPSASTPRGPELAVGPYRLALDRGYDPATHLWVAAGPSGRQRLGFDPLGAETSGDIVAVSLAAPGTMLARGEAFGSLEAAKFVGPLLSPVAGKVTAQNQAVLEDPSLLNADPLGAWMIEVELPADGERPPLLTGRDEIATWFAAEIERFRSQGMLAE